MSQLLTYEQAALMAGVSTRSIRRAVSRRTPIRRRLRVLSLGHRTKRIREVDLNEWIERVAV